MNNIENVVRPQAMLEKLVTLVCFYHLFLTEKFG